MKERNERNVIGMRNENENDVLDLPSLEIVTFGGLSFKYCHLAEFESI